MVAPAGEDHGALVTAIVDIATRFGQRQGLDQGEALMLIADQLGDAGIHVLAVGTYPVLTAAEARLFGDARHTRELWWQPEARRLLELAGADPVAAREEASHPHG
jgi:hypothetical protein